MKLTFTGWHLGAWALPVVASALLAPSLLAQPSLSISGTNVAEGDAGSVQAVVTVTLTPASSGLVTVNYESSPATPAATRGAACGAAGIDFVNPSGTVEFAPGETSQTISVAVCGDTTQEPDEKFRVRLRNAVGATIATAQGTVTIDDDDDQPPTPSVSIEDLSIAEGSGGTTIKNAIVRLSATTGQPVTVTVAVQPGGTASATSACPAGGDFLAFPAQTVTINPGQTELGVPFTICGDTAVEPDESITVVLRDPVNATLLDSQAQVTIANDDVPPPTVSIEDESLSEGSRGITAGSASVRLSATPSRPVTVTVALQTGGTASGGSTCVLNTDFLGFPPRTLTFSPGQTVQSVPFSICGDTSFEPDETFSLSLANPSGATLGDGVGQVTIRDDDGTPANLPPPPLDFQPIPRPALEVDVGGTVTQRAPDLTFVVTAQNSDDRTANNVLVRSTLPRGVAFVRVENSGLGTCLQNSTDAGGALQVNCTLSSFPRSTRSVRIIGAFPSTTQDSTQFTVTANVDPNNTISEANEADNTDSFVGTVRAASDLQVTGQVVRSTDHLPCIGDFADDPTCILRRISIHELRLVVTNNGSFPSRATTISTSWPGGTTRQLGGVHSMDELCPAGQGYSNGDCVSGRDDPCYRTCTIPALNAGASVVVKPTGFHTDADFRFTSSFHGTTSTMDPDHRVFESVIGNNTIRFNLSLP